MELPTLADLKNHLRILHDQEDTYLAGLLHAAVDSASQQIDRPIPWADADNVEQPVPASVRHAILMIAADFYENREAGAVGVEYRPNRVATNLLMPFRANLGV